MSESDNELEFDDLMYFSSFYEIESADKSPVVQENAEETVSISFGESILKEDYRMIPVNINGKVRDVRGVSLTVKGGVEHVIKGELLQLGSAPTLLINRQKAGRHIIDTAVVGSTVETINRTGTLVLLMVDLDNEVQLASVDVRNSSNIKIKTKIIKNDANSSAFPKNYGLEKNSPNPFNSTTLIKYWLPKESHVSLKVYNALREPVKELVNKVQKPGHHEIIMNGTELSCGVYLYELCADGFTAVKKMVLMR